MRRDDFIRLRHMLDASQEAISFAEGKKRGDLDRDRMLVLSLVKEIEIIGEAATKVSEDCRREHPEIPWKNIVTMRNRLMKTVAGELPPLSMDLQRAVAVWPAP